MKETYTFKDTPDFRRIIKENPGAKFITVRSKADVICLIREDWLPFADVVTLYPTVTRGHYPGVTKDYLFQVSLGDNNLEGMGYYAAYFYGSEECKQLPELLEKRLRRQTLPKIKVEAHS
mgnify:CR=1 FL=1